MQLHLERVQYKNLQPGDLFLPVTETEYLGLDDETKTERWINLEFDVPVKALVLRTSATGLHEDLNIWVWRWKFTGHSEQYTYRTRAAFPKVVCLCGSTRYYDTFQKMSMAETLAGNIVLSIGCAQASDSDHIEQGKLTPEQKRACDELHLRKIDLADEILILDVDGYFGESTLRELHYAKANGKNIRYLSQEYSDWVDPNAPSQTGPEQWEVVSDRDGLMFHTRWNKKTLDGLWFMAAHYPDHRRCQNQADEWNKIGRTPWELDIIHAPKTNWYGDQKKDENSNA